MLRDLGLVVRRRTRDGAGTDRAPLPVSSLRWDSQLALQFVNLRASVQLRAMVEDWPLHRIQAAVQEQRLETLRPQDGCPTYPGHRRGAETGLDRLDRQATMFLIWLAAGGIAAVLAVGILGGLP